MQQLPEFEQRTNMGIDRYVEELHIPEDEIDREKIVRHMRKLFLGGAGKQELSDAFPTAFNASYHSFAELDAEHDARTRYRLPYDLTIPRYVTQGVGGERTHQGGDHYAFDFVLPIGAPVLAARPGTVARVRDGFHEGGLEGRFKQKGNFVLVLHVDGTFAAYNHLSPGVKAKKGQVVKRGALLGYSGGTGYSAGPHLHFGVYRLETSSKVQSLPIEFGVGAKQGYVPVAGEYHGFPPQPTVNLKIYVDEKEAGNMQMLPIRVGETRQLRVEAVLPNGRVKDVTQHPNMEYASMTLWSMDVDAKGLIVAKPAKGFEDSLDDPRSGMVSVFYGKRGQREIGLGGVRFEIEQQPKAAQP